MKVALIGGGSMGMAFVRSWLTNEVLTLENVFIIESSANQVEKVRSELPVKIDSNFNSLKDADFIFIAVKPQDFELLAKDISSIIKPDQIVVSIMAGVPISHISELLNAHQRIVRVMPNLPILVSRGISAYYINQNLEQVAANILEQLLKSGGDVLRLENENLLNAVTAISGSGPGYVFYLLQHLMEVSKELGFSQDQSISLLSSTFKGSIKLWQKDSRSAEELCKAVTSKGGTTAAALAHFEENKIGQALKEGIHKAKIRADELANKTT